MITILAIGLGAIAAVRAYNASKTEDEITGKDRTSPKVHGIRQSAAVLLAIGEAVWAVLDALIFLTKSRQSGGGGGPQSQPLRPPSPTFGSRLAGDASDS